MLFLGIKNKYCSTCARTKSDKSPTPHNCLKNWKSSTSSSGMEASIIVDGFLQSEKMYGVRYHKFIADGDSSVYKKILETRPYKNLTVVKVECRNHLLRNLCNKLKDIVSKTNSGKLVHRKMLSGNILRIRKDIVSAIMYRKSNGHSPNDLRNDITNCIYHIFGHHKNCASYFCENNQSDIDYIEKIKSTDQEFFCSIMRHMRNLARHSESLIQNVDSNIVESYNAIIAKVIGGKRINYAMGKSYSGRCMIAAVSKNTRRPLYSLHKALYSKSPAKKSLFNKIENVRKEKQCRQNEARKKNKRFKKSLFKNNVPDLSYGEAASKPDMDHSEFSRQKEDILNEMKEIALKREKIQKETTDQYQSEQWNEIRRKLLTASNFGRIICRRADTGCENIVKSILYNTGIIAQSLDYGKENEPVAKKVLEGILGKPIHNCGLFIDVEHYFLGATPDGLLDDDGLVEIKCPCSASNMTPEEGILSKKIDFWSINKDGTIGNIKKKHKYHYQVQGQMKIANKKYCIFAVWTPKGIKTEKILFDQVFWDLEMFPKLQSFFYDCLLPEIVDPRHPAGLIRNPQYIIDAQEKKKENISRKIVCIKL